MDKYIVSDLIMETARAADFEKTDAARTSVYSEDSFGDVKVCRLNIKDAGTAKKYACAVGRSVTVYTPKMWIINDVDGRRLSEILARELHGLICATLNTTEISAKRFLVAGVGNKRITPDAVGAMAVDNVSVTRHIERVSREDFLKMRVASVCCVNCGVLGETGIESFEILKGVVSICRPDCIIVLDALAAKDLERLAATVQMSDSGITPGAGIGNRQSAINRDTLGVPVIAVGIPTVVSAATLVADTLKRINMAKTDKILERIINENKNFFVAPKECDIICDAASVILARAVDMALGVI